ncbi:hypothetical protein ACWCXM_30915, partial [Streptomyces sp. 900105755]
DRWIEHLGDLGLDPELFRYQREMNADEGEAAARTRHRTVGPAHTLMGCGDSRRAGSGPSYSRMIS